MAMAHTHYLHAAQLARDGKMAELAVRAAITGQDDAGAGRAVALWLELGPAVLGRQSGRRDCCVLKAGDREGALTHLARVIQLAGADGESGYLQVAGIVGRAAGAQERVDLMRDLVALDAVNPDAQQALALVAASADQNDVAVGRGPPRPGVAAGLGQAATLPGPAAARAGQARRGAVADRVLRRREPG